MRKRFTWILVLLFLVCFSLKAAAAQRNFSPELNSSSFKQGETVRMTVNIGDNSELAGFRTTIDFDQSVLSFRRVTSSQGIETKDYHWSSSDGRVQNVYVCDGETAPKLSGEALTYEFTVVQDAEPGSSELACTIEQTVDWSGRLSADVFRQQTPFRVKPPLSSEALLEALLPSEGVLEPEFSPDIQEYRVTVDSVVDRMSFEMEAQSGGTAKVNRTTLLKAGTATEFVITVTAADKKTKSQYLVTVHRAAKPLPEASQAEQEDTGEPQAAVKADLSSKPASSTAAAKPKKGAASTASKAAASKSAVPEQLDDPQPAPEQPENAPAQTIIYGDRNLTITGGQGDSMQMWILIACVCVLIALTASGFRGKDRNKKQ